MANGIMTQTKFVGLKFNTEDQFASAFNQYVSHNYQSLRHFYFHVANENKDMMSVMKGRSMGVLKGVPDFCFLKPHTWFLELKLEGGRESREQRELKFLWQAAGIPVHTVWHPNEAVDILRSKCGEPTFVT